VKLKSRMAEAESKANYQNYSNGGIQRLIAIYDSLISND
jgi:hypothetical protein